MAESEANKPDWRQVLLSQAGRIKTSTYIPLGFGLALCGFLWYRDWSKPPAMQESQPNPARAATPDQAATQSGNFLLSDQLNLMLQQSIYDRATQIKADAARETSDKTARCYRQSPILCVEWKLQTLSQKLSDGILNDGTMQFSPSRATAVNVEMQAMLAAMSGLGAKDDTLQKLIQVYLPAAQAGDSGVVNGAASTVQALDEYLAKRKVDRLAAVGKREDIPERKGGVGNVRSASTLGN